MGKHARKIFLALPDRLLAGIHAFDVLRSRALEGRKAVVDEENFLFDAENFVLGEKV